MKRFAISIAIAFAIPYVCFALPQALSDFRRFVEWMPDFLNMSLAIALGFALAYPILRIGTDRAIQRRPYAAPALLGIVIVALMYLGIIGILANIVFGPIRTPEYVPDWISGMMQIHVLIFIFAFFVTLVIKLCDRLST